MPEVAGDAAITVDPHNTESISNAMNELISNENLRKNLVEKGRKRAMDFNWDASAKRVADIIRSCVK